MSENVVELTAEALQDVIGEAVRKALQERDRTEERAAEQGKENDPLIREELERRLQAIGEQAVQRAEAAVERKLAELNAVPPEPTEIEKLSEWPPRRKFLELPPRDDHQREVQRLADGILFAAQLAPRGHELAAVKRYLDAVDAPENVKALVTDAAGSGAEWVPTITSANYRQQIETAVVVAPLFDTLTMESGSVKWPFVGGDPDVYIKTEASDATEDSGLTSGAVTFSATSLAAYRAISAELDEDSIVSALPLVQAKLARAIARWIDLAILNGDDTDAGHHDSDITSPADPRRAWDGLREKALTDDDANVDLSTFTLENLAAIPAAMGKYADPSALAWIVPPKVFFGKLLTLKDANNNPVFLPGLGGAAASPVVTGEAGKLLGIPVVISPLIRTDLNASGVYDGVTTTQTVLYLVRRDAWVLGVRRDVTAEAQKQVKSGSFDLVVTWRGDFKHLEGSAVTTAIGYNIG